MSARHTHRQPRLERLENRQVLAAFGPSLVEGVLTVEGTNQNDRIVVSLGRRARRPAQREVQQEETLLTWPR